MPGESSPVATRSAGRTVEELVTIADAIVADVILPNAEEIDREGGWPEEGLRALLAAGLGGLHVPTRLGGHGHGLYALARVTETIAHACPSTAMCFGMHCVGTAVIAAKATPFQEAHYLAPIAQGRHLTTLALSEQGTGANFFLPATQLVRDGEGLRVRGQKQFVTNGSHADSYVVSTEASDPTADGEFSCVLVDAGAGGIQWGAPWAGFGMRGNDSRTMDLDTRVPVGNLLGREGEQVWYVFEVVAPYFLVAMAGTYLGIADSALAIATQHLAGRRHSHTGQSLAQLPTLQHRLGEQWIAANRCRRLLHHAAHQGDLGDPSALLSLLASKADASDTAVQVTNEAMTLCGGAAYRDNGQLARLLRDARASHVMSPTTDILKLWIGRLALGLPML